MEFEFVEFDPTDSPRLSETDCIHSEKSKSSSLSFDSDERKFCDWKIKNYYVFCKN